LIRELETVFHLSGKLSNGKRRRKVDYSRAATFHGESGDPLRGDGAAAFQTKARTGHQAEQERIKYLEKKIQRKGSGRADGGAHRLNKRSWGTLNRVWAPHDVRDQIVDFVRRWSEATEIGAGRCVG
jgi:hypothetical protein